MWKQCKLHEDGWLVYKCITCPPKKTLCVYCFQENHFGHCLELANISDIDDPEEPTCDSKKIDFTRSNLMAQEIAVKLTNISSLKVADIDPVEAVRKRTSDCLGNEKGNLTHLQSTKMSLRAYQDLYLEGGTTSEGDSNKFGAFHSACSENESRPQKKKVHDVLLPSKCCKVMEDDDVDDNEVKVQPARRTRISGLDRSYNDGMNENDCLSVI